MYEHKWLYFSPVCLDSYVTSIDMPLLTCEKDDGWSCVRIPSWAHFHLGPAPHSDWKYNNASAQRRLMDPGSWQRSLDHCKFPGIQVIQEYNEEQGGCLRPHAQENISNVRERHIHHKRNLSRLVRICCYLSSCYYLQIVPLTGSKVLLYPPNYR